MSNPTDLSPSERRLAARRALDDLRDDRDDHALVRVRCGRSHHVATVFDTAAGAVYESLIGPHAHGRRDYIDEAHHADRRHIRFVDLLDGDRYTDDVLSAHCECGDHELSRARLRKAVDTHERTIQLG
ncbi:hypothetical protein GPX89_06795 [Nocardia sp. ET3-3]|uniref:Uncharacterized protein n=1 Tax=Nocardia terrae TaxID=2675851 RepID=A0A7K1URI2_9NOCA|nr:hypothetical protein [Nocardia terrae]MVU76952.1 hypothetical protein [Nocardia terrae]